MANKTLAELQMAEEEAKSTYEAKVETPDAGIGLALMGLGMGLQGKGGQFQQIVEAKKAAVRAKRKDLFDSAQNARRELQAQQERDRDRALQQQRFNTEMNFRKTKESLDIVQNYNQMIAKGNRKGAEIYSLAASEKFGTPYVRQFTNKETDKEMMIEFPAGVDSKPIIGALNAGDKMYRMNNNTQFIERLNPETKEYESTGWRGTLSEAYLPEATGAGLEDLVGKGLTKVVGANGEILELPKAIATEGLMKGEYTPYVKDEYTLQKVGDLRVYGNKVLKGDTEFDVATAQANEARFAQSKEYKPKEKEEFVAKADNVISLGELRDDIKKEVKDGTYSDNQYVDMVQNQVAKFVPNDFEAMTDEDLSNAYSRLQTEGRVSTAVARYLKQMSGTAASEKEALRTLKGMFGGGTATSIEARMKVFDSFIDDTSRAADRSGKRLFRQGYQGTTGKYLMDRGIIKGKESTPNRAKMPSRTLNGETRYWNGKAWVK